MPHQRVFRLPSSGRLHSLMAVTADATSMLAGPWRAATAVHGQAGREDGSLVPSGRRGWHALSALPLNACS